MTTDEQEKPQTEFFDSSFIGVQLHVIRYIALVLEQGVFSIGNPDEGDTELEERLGRDFWVPNFSEEFRTKCGNGKNDGLRDDLRENLEGQNDAQITALVLKELGFSSIRDFLIQYRGVLQKIVHKNSIVGVPQTWVHEVVTKCYTESSRYA